MVAQRTFACGEPAGNWAESISPPAPDPPSFPQFFVPLWLGGYSNNLRKSVQSVVKINLTPNSQYSIIPIQLMSKIPFIGRNRIMILQSQALSEFVPIRVASWLVSSLRSEMPYLPIPPILPQPYFLCVLSDLCGEALQLRRNASRR